ncbi:MAG TPA: PHP-associated domain-containing protein [Flexilinea sp.]|nr:PHP-associated domain-containing protein [Flexilinea sp.]
MQRFIEEKLDVVAICDHNASENVPYLMRLSEGKSVTILPGMEITSIEEVHILAIFDNYDKLNGLQHIIYDYLTGKNDESVFGCQVIVNEWDEVEGFNDRLLIGATELSLDAIIEYIHSFGGLAIASHIDRESFSVLSQLGFVDPASPFDALEVSSALGLRKARVKYPELFSYPMIESSDAHFTKDIGSAFTVMYLEEPSTAEIKLAFEKKLGRYVEE